MKTKEIVKKDFDAVKFMRDTRDKISLEIQNMNFEELKKYYAERRLKLAKQEAQQPTWGFVQAWQDVVNFGCSSLSASARA